MGTNVSISLLKWTMARCSYQLIDIVICLFLSIVIFSCTQTEDVTVDSRINQRLIQQEAAIKSVSVGGEPNDYTFKVEVISPDKGCHQYANWWEIINRKGQLIYRRVLLHSHVNEQPFSRSGGPVKISADSSVIIRAHMNTTGYGSQVMIGSVADGFSSDSLAPDFASNLANNPPLPDGCAF